MQFCHVFYIWLQHYLFNRFYARVNLKMLAADSVDASVYAAGNSFMGCVAVSLKQGQKPEWTYLIIVMSIDMLRLVAHLDFNPQVIFSSDQTTFLLWTKHICRSDNCVYFTFKVNVHFLFWYYRKRNHLRRIALSVWLTHPAWLMTLPSSGLNMFSNDDLLVWNGCKIGNIRYLSGHIYCQFASFDTLNEKNDHWQSLDLNVSCSSGGDSISFSSLVKCNF